MTSTRFANHSLEDADRQTVFHPFTALKQFSEGNLGPARIMESGSRLHYPRPQGKRVHRRLRRPLLREHRLRADARWPMPSAAQAKKLAYYQTYAGHSTERSIRLSDRLVSMAPGRHEQGVLGLRAPTPTRPRSSSSGTTTTCWVARRRRRSSRASAAITAPRLAGEPDRPPLLSQRRSTCRPPVLHTAARTTTGARRPGESEEEFVARCARELEADRPKARIPSRPSSPSR